MIAICVPYMDLQVEIMARPIYSCNQNLLGPGADVQQILYAQSQQLTAAGCGPALTTL